MNALRTPSLLEPSVWELLEQVAEHCPGLKSIWLIGSRSNGTARNDSDWDLIAFGNDAIADSCAWSFARPGAALLLNMPTDHISIGWCRDTYFPVMFRFPTILEVASVACGECLQ